MFYVDYPRERPSEYSVEERHFRAKREPYHPVTSSGVGDLTLLGNYTRGVVHTMHKLIYGDVYLVALLKSSRNWG